MPPRHFKGYTMTHPLTLTDIAKQHDAYLARRDKYMADGIWCQMRLWDAMDGYPLGPTDLQALEAWITVTVDSGAYVE